MNIIYKFLKPDIETMISKGDCVALIDVILCRTFKMKLFRRWSNFLAFFNKESDYSYYWRKVIIGLESIADVNAITTIISEYYLSGSLMYKIGGSKWREDVENLLKLKKEFAIDPLVKFLASGHKNKGWIIKLLGELGDNSAVDQLIISLKDDEYYIRIDAALALGKIGDKKAVEALINLLQDQGKIPINLQRRADTRNAAAQALGEISDVKALDPLIRYVFLLDNSSLWGEDKFIALESIAKILKAQTENVIIAENEFNKMLNILNSAPVPGMKKSTAVEVLGYLGNKKAIDPLCNQLNKFYELDWLREYRGLNIIISALSILGAKGLIDSVLKTLFKFPLDYDDAKHLVSTLVKLQPDIPKEIIELIIRISTYRWEYFLSRKGLETQDAELLEDLEAVDQLCNIKTSYVNNLLNLLVIKQPVFILVSNGNCRIAWKETNGIKTGEYISSSIPKKMVYFQNNITLEITFHNQRKRAMEELVNRGNPHYDPTVYH